MAAFPADRPELRTLISGRLEEILVLGAVVLWHTPGFEFEEAFGTRPARETPNVDPVPGATKLDHITIRKATTARLGHDPDRDETQPCSSWAARSDRGR